MSDNSAKNGDWNSYRLYVIECLKKLTDNVEKFEKEISDLRMEFLQIIYKNKEEYQLQLRDLANTVLKLQIRLGIICAGLTIFISILANVLMRIFISEIK